MIKYLLPENGQFYKANLHCHSTLSDGRLTPEELKDAYQSHGYSVLSITDHDLMVPHHDLTDPDFLMMTGFEMGFDEKRTPGSDPKTCHLCFVALNENEENQPCFHRTEYLDENRRKLAKFDPDEPDFVREYTPECINRAIRIGKEKGFFITYNHPVWSLERYNDYSRFEGMHAMEICNYSSVVSGWDEYNPRVYEDFLHQNKRIFVVGADDNHNRQQPDHPKWDSFGAFTVVKAPALTYRAIADALLAGHFYASQGPEIKGLWLDGNVLNVECSPAVRVYCITKARRCMAGYGENGGLAEHAEFQIRPSDGYVRISVQDEKGNRADSNAYFTDELFD
ncbi:MAG: PHP domain-containing protein [Clostridia bacterium]|nr:PHP domain-containing protein [Clostridia bacterium]